jgi:arsenate reductase (thioredoxin)
MTAPLHPDRLAQTIAALAHAQPNEERKSILDTLVNYIQKQLDAQQAIRLNFICTHNSRRSHLSQVWAQTLAHHFGIGPVFCYSGGTEATALFPKAAETLQHHGFGIQRLSEGSHPIYAIKYDGNAHAIIGFSKSFDDPFNPQSAFAAIMTCSQADEGCPFIAGADVRIPLTFEDPKAYDNTPLQDEKYKERSLQIASELFYVFSQIKKI